MYITKSKYTYISKTYFRLVPYLGTNYCAKLGTPIYKTNFGRNLSSVASKNSIINHNKHKYLKTKRIILLPFFIYKFGIFKVFKVQAKLQWISLNSL